MPKKQRKTKKTSKRYELYDKEKRKNKFCPKCGPGIFLAAHKDRLVCGKCHYMEAVGSAAPKEQPKPQEKPKDKPKETPKEEKKEQHKAEEKKE